MRAAVFGLMMMAVVGVVACSEGDAPPGAPSPAATVTAAPTRGAEPIASATSTAEMPPSPQGGVRPGPGTPAPTPRVDDRGVPIVPLLRRLTFSAGNAITDAELAARGYGPAGRGTLNVARVVLPRAGVDAAVEAQVVGPDGQMPEPSAADVVAWYDFSVFSGIGGLPLAGGNAVFAGDLDRTGVGPGVFWTLHEVATGDIVTLVLLDGRELYYHVEFNKVVGRDIDFGVLAAATADESATFITATGAFSAGGYAERRVVWARRVNCAPGGVSCELPE